MKRPLPRLLIVDDLPSNIQHLAEILDGMADISAATSGARAFGLLESGLMPDLILLDLCMPGLDGFAVCAALAGDPRWCAIPVICVTARTDAASESMAIRAGMIDFIHKPLSAAVVRARVTLHLERQAQSKALDAARARELSVARLIQSELLLSPVPDRIGPFELAVTSQASQVVDGDFHALTQFDGGCFEVLVGDVMGKGINAALAGAAVTTQYRTALTRLILGGAVRPSVAEVVNEMNHMLHAQLDSLETFVTLALVRFDAAAGSLSWVNAGHTTGLILRNGTTRAMAAENMPLGISGAETYIAASSNLAPGDTVLLWSDGFSEATDHNGAEFGDDRIIAFAQEDGGSPPAQTLSRLVAAVRDHAGEHRVQDDRSAFCVRYAA